VVNNEPGLSDHTRERIEAAIAELGYRPNFAARSLVTRRSNLIGLVVPDLTNPFFPSLADGVQRAALSSGQTVVLGGTHEDPEEQRAVIDSLVSHGADGLVIFPVQNTEEQLKEAVGNGLAVVLVNAVSPDPRIGRVASRLAEGAELAVDHLVERGHRSIGMVACSTEPEPLRDRERGFLSALDRNGFDIATAPIPRRPPTVEGGHRAALELFERSPSITALFAYNDLMAIGAIRACFELGRRVPADCAVVGFDDIELVSELTPALTTIRSDRLRMGREAVRLLAAMIADRDTTAETVELDMELVVRETT
jgi:LacI family transcriptional regulator